MQVAKGWGLDCIAGVVIIICTYTYSKIQFANTGMKKLRNDVRNKKETLQKLIENYKINK
jgi:hypothetical protein